MKKIELEKLSEFTGTGCGKFRRRFHRAAKGDDPVKFQKAMDDYFDCLANQ